MYLGELVNMIVSIAINTHNSLSICTESPYHSEEELREGIIRNYHTKIRPFIDELNERERSYSK